MSTNSNDNGRAYEYAWIMSLYEALHKIRKVRIANNSSFVANERAWKSVSGQMQELFKLSADSAVGKIIELEPHVDESADGELLLEFQKDDAGKKGDVRDILIKRGDIRWEIGLSIKHNHEAVKHSRLSYKLDFAKEWFGVSCSVGYWQAVTPVFDRLRLERNKGVKWSELTDKADSVYIPLLQAFIAEVKRASRKDPSVPKKMVEYLVGTNDYYKAVSHEGEHMTLIHTFNVHGTLNRPSQVRVSKIKVPIAKLPTEIVNLRFKPQSNNTAEMYLNNGWQLNFRIHNASTRVEPSLKFDVQLIGMPASILTIKCEWSRKP